MAAEAQGIPGQRAAGLLGEKSNWWVAPVAVAVGFTLFIVYGFWSVFLGSGGHAWDRGPYLSPFYSPLFKLGWWPFSSAILVAWAPLGFRATCYYYRKAYYRAFFGDPAVCARKEPRFWFLRPATRHREYKGERGLPWLLNNFHRFFLYAALVVLGFLWYDTINSFHYRHGLYVGLGSILMLVNVALLTLYTFSCHALRHLVGGNINCYTCAAAGQVRHGMWGLVSRINPFHGSFAWASLFSVAAVDIYIRLVSSGAFGSCFGAHAGC